MKCFDFGKNRFKKKSPEAGHVNRVNEFFKQKLIKQVQWCSMVSKNTQFSLIFHNLAYICEKAQVINLDNFRNRMMFDALDRTLNLEVMNCS